MLSCGGMRHDSTAALDAVVDRAMAYGVNHFETARMYMGGRSEKDFGRTLQRYPRESFILQTKVAPRSDPRKFEAEVLDSMKNLRADYLDLFAFHGVNRASELDYILREGGCLEVARRLQQAGKIRNIGFSTHAPTPVILAAIESGAFSYVNLHFHFVGSYTSSGTAPDGSVGCGGVDGVAVPDGGNGVAVAAACASGMGVFIISTFDKGGKLFDPPPQLSQACAPLHPMQFGSHWLWSRRAAGPDGSLTHAVPTALDYTSR